MARRYVGVRTVGRPTQIIERVRQVVQKLKLTRMIPVVKFERKPRGEFYVFLAVEGTDEIGLPDQVRNALKLSGFTSSPDWPLPPDAIESMASRAKVETHSLSALKYKSLWSNDAGDPYDLSDVSSSEGEIDDPSLGERYDQLLYWLSATAEGRWQTFAQVCQVLQLADDTTAARSIFRRLILLGHIECSDDGLRWSICPSALVRRPTDTNGYFLCGQRTPKLLNQLHTHLELEDVPQPGYQGPSCVKVNGEPPADAVVDGARLEPVGIVAVQLARLLPDLQGWKNTLTPLDRISTAHYTIEIWDGERFVPSQTFYEREGRYFGESGMYRLTRGEGANAYQQVLYLDQPNQRWLKGDWYGLRFLAQLVPMPFRDDAANVDFEVKYDSGTGELLMPADERWPLLYERALVLATGILPCRAENPKWLKYSGVSDELARRLTAKLNVSIREV
jgi:hypothetical protein